MLRVHRREHPPRTSRDIHLHLGTVRHRAAKFKYRLEEHAAIFGERLAALQGAEFRPCLWHCRTRGLANRLRRHYLKKWAQAY